MKSLKPFYHRHEMTIPRAFETLAFLVFIPLAFLGMFLFSYGVLLPWITVRRGFRAALRVSQQGTHGAVSNATR